MTQDSNLMTSFSPMLTTFLGHSAVFAAISEILHRGYNVALPLIDTGDDFYVYKHPGKTYARIQVKSATPHPLKTKPAHQAHFRIPLTQLHTRHQPDLIYILTTRDSSPLYSQLSPSLPIPLQAPNAHRLAPTFILIPRRRLLRLHTQHNFGSISTDRLHISLTIHPHHIQSHYQNLQPHRNAFHKYFP